DFLAPKLETNQPIDSNFYMCYVSPMRLIFFFLSYVYCSLRTRSPRAHKPHVDYSVAFLLTSPLDPSDASLTFERF
ncbi:hypothetical protein K443DRAFT_89875, partial [Laccaria amethystina LaAM-08-1]